MIEYKWVRPDGTIVRQEEYEGPVRTSAAQLSDLRWEDESELHIEWRNPPENLTWRRLDTGFVSDLRAATAGTAPKPDVRFRP